MGCVYVGSSGDLSFDNYVCDNCGESALVLCGNIPAGWYESFVFDLEGMVARSIGDWYCPVCRTHEEERK